MKESHENQVLESEYLLLKFYSILATVDGPACIELLSHPSLWGRPRLGHIRPIHSIHHPFL